MRKDHLYRLVFAVMMSFFIISCGGSPESTEEDEPLTVEVTEVDDPGNNEFLYTLPSPLQIASIFRRSGLEYIPE